MKLEVKYIFPTSTPGVNNYICKLRKGPGMRTILAHGTRIQKNPQTREDIFWIFTDFHRVMLVQRPIYTQIEISSMGSLTLKLYSEFSQSWKIILSNFPCFKSFILSAIEPV